MPELPEVEVNRRGLERLVQDKVIKNVQVFWPKIVADMDVTAWQERLIDQQILSVSRRGKFLIFNLTDGYLISHLRMEGKYFFYLPEEVPLDRDKHSHIIFTFEDNSQLHYHDVRKFGRMNWVEAGELDPFFDARQLGPEPTEREFDLEVFTQQLHECRQMIKPALLSQRYVAGLGNIYVDEVLYLAQIHPMTRANTLTESEICRLHHQIIDVLQRAVDAGGSTIRTYRNIIDEAGSYQDQLIVYGKQGELCPRCQTPIEKMKVAQRGTHWCPTCQILKER